MMIVCYCIYDLTMVGQQC